MNKILFLLVFFRIAFGLIPVTAAVYTYPMPDEFNTGYKYGTVSPSLPARGNIDINAVSGADAEHPYIIKNFSIINHTDTAMAVYFKYSCKNITLRNFWIEGNVRIVNMAGYQCENITLENFYMDVGRYQYRAVNLTNVNNLIIRNGEIKGGLAEAVMANSKYSGQTEFTASTLIEKCYIHDCFADGIKVQGNTTVKQCYIKRSNYGETYYRSHGDGIQSLGEGAVTRNISIIGNRIDNPHTPLWSVANSALFITGENSDMADINIEGNYLNGGGYTATIGVKGNHVRYDSKIVNNFYGGAAVYGFTSNENNPQNNLTVADNHRISEPLLGGIRVARNTVTANFANYDSDNSYDIIMAAAAYKGNKLISAGVESRKTLPRYPNRDEYFPDETYYDENGTDERYHEDVHQYIDEYILPYMREIDPNTASFTDGQIEAMLKPAWVPSHTSKTVKLWLPSETRSGAGYAWAWYTRMREYPDFNEYFPTDVKIGVNIDTAGADKVKVFFFKDFESLQVYGEAREIELP